MQNDLRTAKTDAEKVRRPTLHEESGGFRMLLHHSKPESYPEESHDTYQVCVPYQGARYDVLRSGDSGTRLTHRLRAGDILVVPAGQPHAVNWLRPADILSLYMTSAFLEEILEKPIPEVRDSLVLHDPLISQMAIEVRRSFKEGSTSPLLLGAFAAFVGHRVVRQALGTANLSNESVAPLAPHERSRIAEYIDTHLHRAIRVTELAAMLGLSQWHFLRRFHVTEGTTPNQYIIKRRVDRASTMLVRTDMSVTQVAIEVGMSPNHFSRSFLRAKGIPPAAFRRRRRSSP